MSVQSDSDIEPTDQDRQNIRDNLKNLSFEELIKLKEKLGSKVYNETVYGTIKQRKTPKELKRVNKNRPREVSSKIRAKKLKLITQIPVIKTSKPTAPRDPRFDPLCGEFDRDTFKSNYGFVSDIRQKEKKALQQEYNECTDPERKETIKLLIQRVENQLREEEKTRKVKEKERDEKKEIREKLKKGEKPVFKNKSTKKMENLVEKYEELKKKNKLHKHIEKRNKKLKSKDRKTKMIE